MWFRILYLNLIRLNQSRKSLTCRLATHLFVGLQLESLLVRNSQLVVSHSSNTPHLRCLARS